MDDSTVPLVVTADARLLDEVLRLCAAVGATPTVVSDAPAARRGWAEASMVVVGDDVAPVLAQSAPGRRSAVVIVSRAPELEAWSAAVALGAHEVLALPADQGRFIESLATAMDGRDEACLVATVGATGGAGTSTFAGALALVAAGRGLRSLLVDADPLGGGVDVLMGSEHIEGLRWPDIAQTQGRISGESLRRALPVHAGLSTLSWDRGQPHTAGPDAMRSVLGAGRRSFDAIVVDAPRSVDESVIEVVSRAVLTVLVAPESVRGLGAAMSVLARLRETAGEVALVTRTMPHGMAGHIIAERLGLPLLARVRSDRQLPGAIDAGFGPLAGRTRSMRQACTRVLDTLGLDAK